MDSVTARFVAGLARRSVRLVGSGTLNSSGTDCGMGIMSHLRIRNAAPRERTNTRVELSIVILLLFLDCVFEWYQTNCLSTGSSSGSGSSSRIR